jgi:predicted dehydrogenase
VWRAWTGAELAATSPSSQSSWLCDSSPGADIASRYTRAVHGALRRDARRRWLDAVVVATPVPTHFELAQRALGRKHVFVEKPPAMGAAEIDELIRIADERDLVLMPGHLLLYHPGVRKLKELIDAGELGEVLCVYGNRQNLGVVRSHENALWSLGVHDLSVILHQRNGKMDLHPEPRLVVEEGDQIVVFATLEVLWAVRRAHER